MIATQTLKTKQVDINDNKESDYRYGKLIKAETNYISKKVLYNGFEKENLEAIYTLTFIDHKTNITESFQYNLLPDSIGKNYFYCVSEGNINILSNNKNDFIEKLLNNKQIDITGKYYFLLFSFCVFMFLFYLLFDPLVINNSDPFFVFINFITTAVATLPATIPFCFIYCYVNINKNEKLTIDKLQKNLDNLIKKEK